MRSFVERLGPAREVKRRRRPAAPGALERRIHGHAAVHEHHVAAERIVGAGVTLRHAGQLRLVVGNRLAESGRADDTAADFRVERVAGELLEDEAEHQVVGVGVVPSLAGGERRGAIEEVGELFLHLPDAIRILEQVGEKPVIELVSHQSAGVVHDLADCHRLGVREALVPGAVAEIARDRRVEHQLPFVHQLECNGRDVGLPDASLRHERCGTHRLATRRVGHADREGQRPAVGEYDAEGGTREVSARVNRIELGLEPDLDRCRGGRRLLGDEAACPEQRERDRRTDGLQNRNRQDQGSDGAARRRRVSSHFAGAEMVSTSGPAWPGPSPIAPDRQLVAAGIGEVEAAATRELADRLDDLAARRGHPGPGRPRGPSRRSRSARHSRPVSFPCATRRPVGRPRSWCSRARSR